MKLDLRVRDLKTGEDTTLSFEGEEKTKAWLAARPPFVEVLGVPTAGLSHETVDGLKAAMRPLDADEALKVRELQNAVEKERIERDRAARAAEMVMQEQHKEAMKTGDPERLMEVNWRFDNGMRLADPADPRPIPEVAQEAIMAWIAERNEWVAGRGQIVGEATVKVWPGKLPAKTSDRVSDGRFVPVTAPEKPG